jgi:hypothetical protein
MAIAGPGLPFPFGHEPALTIVPNFLATGILAMFFGLTVIVWSSVCVTGRFGATVLFLLSILLFLFGGGFGPMSLLIAAWTGATGIDRPLTWWRKRLPAGLRGALAALWPWFLGAALCWVPVEFVLGFMLHLKNDPRQTLTNLNFLLTYPLLAFIALALVAGFAREAERKELAP